MPHQRKNLLPKEGQFYHWPSFFSADESATIFDELLKTTSWEQYPIKLFGRTIFQPRQMAWYADHGLEYTYSGLTLRAKAWPDLLVQIKKRVEGHLKHTFNFALLNLYRDGLDHMGWHADNEPELGNNPVIASVSFGATRTFRLKHRRESHLKLDRELKSGDLLIMADECQRCWLHSLPKRKKIKGARINITFRQILT